MKVLRTAALALGAAAALCGCSQSLPTYRYRMTVEVETPEGLRSGSSVIEVQTWKGGGFPGPEAAQMAGELRGEAVAVDLGRRGTLFALLQSPDQQYGAGGYAWALLRERPAKGSEIEAQRANHLALRAVKGSAELPREWYPMLVRFRDIRDPMTVEEVDPDQLEQNFGQDVRLKRVVVEITDDLVDFNIKDKIRWIDQFYNKRFDGQTIGNSNTLQNRLDKGHFIRGDDQ